MHHSCSRVQFQQVSGHVVTHPQRLISIGHTALVAPWSDPNIHQHQSSEEFYLLMQGQLHLVINDFRISLHRRELLLVRQGVPHAVIGGAGAIEYFGIRAPALDDKQVVGELVTHVPLVSEDERLISAEWGQRIPLDMPQHKNCWLVGAGSALFASQNLAMAYLDFPTQETANAGIGTRHQLHYHQKSWEYYTVLMGEKVLLIEGEQVPIRAGETLAVPPHVKHTLYSRQAPFQGFTIRVPVDLDDKIVVNT
jgi:mannose-6-phosphate isomerase-like protein (cupin superfamily)